PTLVRAEEYLASGRYYWNLSMFAWRASAFLDELERVAPRHYEGLLGVRAGTGSYADLPNEAVDYAVLERTDRLYLVPGTFDWLDVGSWAELLEMLPGDENGNSIDGESAVIDTRGSLLSAPGKLVAAIGIEDMIVIDTAQALLVLPRSRAQDVKKIVEMLRRSGKTGYL
ncbi:MAG TPA: sugar phosphate nucleotidyltransferase, partial [Candidatus Dormibacteraeota bacterium]